MKTLNHRLQAWWPTRMKMSIRARISLLTFGLALPFFAYTVLASIAEARVEREHASQQMLASARITAGRLDDYIHDISQMLRVLSVTVSADPAHVDENDAYLRKLEGQVPVYLSNITVWAPNGDNIGTLDTHLRAKGPVSLPNRKFFREAMAGTELGIEAPVTAISNGKLIGLFSVPIRQDDKVIGVVAVSTRLTPLQELLTSGSGLPPGAVVTITDVSGVVLARSIDPEKYIGRNMKGSGGVTQALQKREGTREGPSTDGIDRVAGFTTARAAPWLVYVGVPTDVALATVHARLRRNLLSGTAVLCAGLLLAYLVGEGIASPLRELSVDAEKFGQGELAHRSQVNARGEVGLLAATMNAMAEQLQERRAALVASEHRMQMISDNIPALVSYVDAEERYQFVNAFSDDVFSAGAGSITGRTIREVRGETAYANLKGHIDDALAGKRVVFTGDWPIDGELRHYQATYIPDLDESGTVVGFYALTFDVTDMKRTQDQLDALARVDSLTGLANRRAFEERLRDAMARTRRSNHPLAMLFLDVDHFKAINDTFGHAGGDQVLTEFAQRLTAEVRETDMVARFAGDEFVILLEGVSHPADLKALAGKIVESIRTPFEIGTEVRHVTTSVGVASYHGDVFSAAELIGEADEALYEAKRHGRDRYVMARPALQLVRPRWHASGF